MGMLRRMLGSRKGTAEIVGTVLFLVILFFFFSNVFLWHDQIAREMDSVTADKMNSAVKIETTTTTRVGVDYSHLTFSETAPDNKTYVLQFAQVDFTTGIDPSQDWTLVAAVHLNILASYSDFDAAGEVCYAYIYDFEGGQWVDTGLRVSNALVWLNVTLSEGTRYIDRSSGGLVEVEFIDSSQVGGIPDAGGGKLSITKIEVTVDMVALQVTDLGGVDAGLSRLWITDSSNHAFVDLEPIKVSVPAGSSRNIVFSASVDPQDIPVTSPIPLSGQTLTFKVLTTLGNTAACSYSFP
jgi:hypothetical protein